jgi:Fe-S-cluster formation regulator IscX/YfhJ
MKWTDTLDIAIALSENIPTPIRSPRAYRLFKW